MRNVSMFVHQVTITRDLLDELGHANYNALKSVFETARHRLCKHLGFGRKNLRVRLGIGFVMLRDSYEYHKALKEGDVISVIPQISIVGATKLTIKLAILRQNKDSSVPELTDEATHEMAMIDLKRERPIRIPKPILRSVEHFNKNQVALQEANASTLH